MSGNTHTGDAIVDWVYVELRDTRDTNIVHSRAALLQADGDIVEVDGVSDITFAGVATGNYFVVIGHRNHLAVMTAGTIALRLGQSTVLDMSSPAVSKHGLHAMKNVNGVDLLYGGGC